MERRRLLGLLGTGLAAGVAGCAGGLSGGQSGAGTAPRGRAPRPPSLADTALPVPDEQLRHPLPRDYIPAIVEPAVGTDWSGVAATLPDGAPVLGVTRRGTARAYPIRVLSRHELVNDDLGGPVGVSYCILCGSGVVFERRVAGEPAVFGVSGSLWRSDLVMYDRATDSRWSQLLATAIQGPRTGDRLSLLPVSFTTWGEWRRQQPGTEVLLPPPASETLGRYERNFDYDEPRYDYREDRQLVGRDSFDGGLHPKTLVLGVRHGGVTRAYPFPAVAEAGVVNDDVGGLPVAVTVTPEGGLAGYDRRVDGETRRFDPAGETSLRGAGSRWRRSTGRAVDGPHEGTRLDAATGQPPMFWHGWSKFYPETTVYGET
jgi:hypothetical protein